ncbi:hypothetical protein BZA05DRAFT_421296 [Tricharina praecox]|uniref:uncharacterized protein n=1 Tax=Tricharina praecox TaxID=43433 RepID=UPI00221F9B92|nr:uncharacterized protein BZA05DRAFT_421296 [Tricharina praecox]KAI5845472.1 hypothetical protein BZA05DRAFT_421296 [Tricharina praecox]
MSHANENIVLGIERPSPAEVNRLNGEKIKNIPSREKRSDHSPQPTVNASLQTTVEASSIAHPHNITPDETVKDSPLHDDPARTRLIELHLWEGCHLSGIGATVSRDHIIPTGGLSYELFEIIHLVCPFGISCYSVYLTSALLHIFQCAYAPLDLDPIPENTKLRQSLCAKLTSLIIQYLSPMNYEGISLPLQLRFHGETTTWKPYGFVGSNVWWTPKRPSTDFAEETAYALSLAQEAGDAVTDEADFEFWLISIRPSEAAVIKTTVAGDLLEPLDVKRVEELGSLGGPQDKLRNEVTKVFWMAKQSDRIAFVEALAGLVEMANKEWRAGSPIFRAA